MKKLDFHVHIYEGISIDESVRNFNDMCERFGYEGVGIMALCHNSKGYHESCNEQALEIKSKMPGSYAFASLHIDRPSFVEQAEDIMARGFDGIKLLNGKPSEYRHFGFGYEDPKFYEFFEYAEKYQIPLMIHNNDPEYSWDINRVSKSALAKGWYYDEKMPSQKFFFDVLDDVFATFPNLRAAIAHLGFYTESIQQLEKADKMLETYKNLSFDITPALNIYAELSKIPGQAQAFFTKNHERLIFGTDAINDLTGYPREYNNIKNAVTDAFIQGKSRDSEVARSRNTACLDLTAEMMENIYYNNALRFIKR